MQLHSSVTNLGSLKAFSTLEKKFNIRHNNKYDYTKSIYVNSRTPIIITCPIHGDFEQRPEYHLSGNGCKKCGLVKLSENKKVSLEEYVKKAEIKHFNTYTYLSISYPTKCAVVEYKCSKHGIITQDAASHLRGNGCKQCGVEARASYRFKSKKQVIHEFVKIHGDKYDYSSIEYKGTKTHIDIKCHLHGTFSQTPDNHLQGTGCPGCAVTGFDTSKPGILYYLSINDGQAYKLGITNRSVKQRYINKDLENIQILHQVHYKNGQDAYLEERRIMTEFKQYKYIGPNLLRDGNTELFSCNILNLKENNEQVTTQHLC